MHFQTIIQRVLRALYNRYKLKPRSYAYKGVKIEVLPEVFHPGFFFSTKWLLEFLLKNRAITKKKILELGAGSGLISTYLAKGGGDVYASDINPKAVENVKLNAQLNDQQVTVFYSDLFDDIPQMMFDYILINPPYYPKKPSNNEEKAWYCGEDFEYYQKLFTQLSRFASKNSEVFMVMSENCDLGKIGHLAELNDWTLSDEASRVFIRERLIIYRIDRVVN